jgi:RimJ/RimL family protein N-acetyltransferase
MGQRGKLANQREWCLHGHAGAIYRTDVDRLIAWISSPQLLSQWAASGFLYPLGPAQMEAHMRKSAETGALIFKGLDQNQSVVGHVELGSIDRLNRSLRIGRVLVAPERRGRGIGVELMRAALGVAFDQLQMHRVELAVFDFNHAAIGCYERVGFQREGVRREMFRSADGYWSEIVMSILESQWRRSDK